MRVAFAGTYGDTTWANVMWLLALGTGTPSSDDLIVLADRVADVYTSDLLSHTNTACTLETTGVTFFRDGEDDLNQVVTVGAAGTVDTGQLPANLSICISWSILPSYRGGHPRTYLPGIDRSYQGTERLLNTGIAAALQTSANSFHTDLEGTTSISAAITGVEHGIVSFQRAGEWRTPPVFYRITGAHVDDRMDTQRGRLGADLP